LLFVCVTKSVTVSLNSFGTLCLEEGTQNLSGCVRNEPGAASLKSSVCPRFEQLEDGDLHMVNNCILNFISQQRKNLAEPTPGVELQAPPSSNGAGLPNLCLPSHCCLYERSTLGGGRAHVMLCQ